MIPFCDLRRSVAGDLDALVAAARRVIESGAYILGPEVELFERDLARITLTEHVVGVSSGTDALLATLMALGIGKGDEIVCPAFGFVATANVVSRVGATPVFADVTPEDMTLDPESVARKTSPRTRAVIAVHLFGRVAPVGAISRAAGDAPVVEDAAQAILATLGERRAGSLGRAGCFSLHPTKNLGAFGDAGFISTDDGELAARLRLVRSQGASEPNAHTIIGANFRIDALQAALVRVRLEGLEDRTRRRVEHAARYAEGLGRASGIDIPRAKRGRGERHVFHQFVIRVHGTSRRDDLARRLAARGIQTRIYYPTPLHLQPCFASLRGRAGDHPVAELLARECLALPIFPELREGEVDDVARAVLELAGARA